MTTFSSDDDVEAITRRHDRSTLCAKKSGRHRRCDVNCVSSRDWRSRTISALWHVEQTFIKHVFGTAVTLFARLKHKQHTTRQVGFAFAQHTSSTSEHAHVGVVPACMHCIFYARRKLEPSVFGHWQCVHVTAQHHCWSRLVSR